MEGEKLRAGALLQKQKKYNGSNQREGENVEPREFKVAEGDADAENCEPAGVCVVLIPECVLALSPLLHRTNPE